MSLLNYMQKNRFGVYEYKRRIPKDLLEQLPQYKSGFIKFSLQTKNADEAKRLNKAKDRETEELFNTLRGIDMAALPPASVTKTVNNELPKHHSTPASGKHLQDIITLWVSERRPDEKTIEAMKLTVSMFEESRGTLDIVHITKTHIIDFRRWLTSIKSNRNKGLNNLSTTTINKHIANLTILLNIAIKYDYIGRNVAKGFKLKKTVEEQIGRLPFEQADLEALFYTEDYKSGTGRRLIKDHTGNIGGNSRYWLPLLALFTGARVDELAQLTVDDIKSQSGISYINVTSVGDGKSIKNISSVRKIPIHNELIKLGFIDYWQEVVDSKLKLLFDDLVGYKNKKSHYFSKWFGYHKRTLGITDRRKVFHSFRHSFKDFAKESRMDTEISHKLTGHSSQNAGDKYGQGYTLLRLNEELQKFNPPISFADYYIETSQPLNPVPKSTQTTALPVKQRQQVSSEELMGAVSLAEAYNRLGKAYCGTEWIDYQMCVLKGSEWVKVDLKEKLAKNYKKQLELHPLELNDLKNLELIAASSDDIKRHKQTLTYLEKGITKGLTDCIVRSYRKLKGNANFEVIELDDWNDMKQQSYQFPLSIYESKATASKQWLVLVDSVSLDGYIKRCGW